MAYMLSHIRNRNNVDVMTMNEEQRLRARIADLEDRLLASGQWHARPRAHRMRNTLKRAPVTISLDTLKEVMRDYCIQTSGEITNEVDNLYVIVGSKDGGIPLNFSYLTIEFANEREE